MTPGGVDQAVEGALTLAFFLLQGADPAVEHHFADGLVAGRAFRQRPAAALGVERWCCRSRRGSRGRPGGG